MKHTAVEYFVEQLEAIGFSTNNIVEFENEILLAKEMEEKKLLEMLHKFAFDYTYNYRGEKTIYEWIPEWFEEYKRLEEKFINK